MLAVHGDRWSHCWSRGNFLSKRAAFGCEMLYTEHPHSRDGPKNGLDDLMIAVCECIVVRLGGPLP
jgi:hypothetical protein